VIGEISDLCLAEVHCITSRSDSPSLNHAITIFNSYLGITTQQKPSIGPFFLVPPKTLYSPPKRVFSYLSPLPQEFESVWHLFHHLHIHSFLYSLLNTFSAFPALELFFLLFLYYSTCIFSLFSFVFFLSHLVRSGLVWSAWVGGFSQVWVYDFQSMNEVFFSRYFYFISFHF